MPKPELPELPELPDLPELLTQDAAPDVPGLLAQFFAVMVSEVSDLRSRGKDTAITTAENRGTLSVLAPLVLALITLNFVVLGLVITLVLRQT